MLCISTKERKHVVSQSKRRRPPIEINLQIYRCRSESEESVRSPSRKDEHTLFRLPACVRHASSSNSNSTSNNTDLPHKKKSRKTRLQPMKEKTKTKIDAEFTPTVHVALKKIPHYIQNEIVHVKLLNTDSPCSRTKSPCTSSIRVVRSLPHEINRS